MSRRTIFVIIMLASIAVLGVMLLQASFIMQTYRAQELSFTQRVAEAMSHVMNQIEQRERIEMELHSENGYTVVQITDARKEMLRRQLTSDIANRVRMPLLDSMIKAAFKDQQINLNAFHYGVYSDRQQQLVWEDGHFNVTGTAVTADQAALIATPYKMRFFPKEPFMSGVLMAHFPEKNSEVWGKLWLTLALSVLFSLVILMCFAYTIHVILQQKKLSDMKNDFINNMTHEFKTPIATISLASDAILMPNIIANPEKIRNFMDKIKQENLRLNAQVEKVLQMASLDKDELKLKVTNVNINEIVQQAIGNIQLRVEKRAGVARAILNAENPMVQGDITHIASIVNNLLDNADKYSPEQPDITVETKTLKSGVQIIVTDNGMGMTKESKRRIFEKFYRVPTGNLHDVKGFGLGLSYVKAMVTAHRGTVEVESELGKGSSFTLFFPFFQTNL